MIKDLTVEILRLNHLQECIIDLRHQVKITKVIRDQDLLLHNRVRLDQEVTIGQLHHLDLQVQLREVILLSLQAQVRVRQDLIGLHHQVGVHQVQEAQVLLNQVALGVQVHLDLTKVVVLQEVVQQEVLLQDHQVLGLHRLQGQVLQDHQALHQEEVENRIKTCKCLS